jgi:hypothetical protein
MRWGEIHTSQDVEKNNQIACEIVYFHDAPPAGLFKQKLELLSNNKLKWIKADSPQFFNKLIVNAQKE